MNKVKDKLYSKDSELIKKKQNIIFKSVENKKSLINKPKCYNYYIKYFVNDINKAKDVDELRDVFKKAISLKNIFNTNGFENDIWKIDEGLSYIDKILKSPNNVNILDEFVKAFVSEHKAVLKKINNNLYSMNYLKQNVLFDFYKDKTPELISKDVIFSILNNKPQTLKDYQLFNFRLIDWLINCIYQNNNKLVNEQNEKSVKKINNLNGEDSIPYMGRDIVFYTQLNILHDRKKQIERERYNELMILSKKHNLKIQVYNHKKQLNKINKFEKKPVFEKKDLTPSYNNRMTYEERLYEKLEIHYNRKYLKIDEQERAYIKSHSKMMQERSKFEINSDEKCYIKKHFNKMYKLNLIKLWANKTISPVFVQNQDGENQKSFIKYILNITAKKATYIMGLKPGNNLIDLKDNYIKSIRSLTNLNEGKMANEIKGIKVSAFQKNNYVNIGVTEQNKDSSK